MTQPNFASPQEERILILAPTGRDALMSMHFLTEAKLHPVSCESIEVLAREFQQGCGLILLTGEALTILTARVLFDALAGQPAWSDVPLLVLTSGGGAIPTNNRMLTALGHAGNVTLVERPVRTATLLSAITSALRARRHQYDVRDQLAEEVRVKEALRLSEERLRIALEAAQLGAWELDLTTGRLDCTPSFKANFGLSPDTSFSYEALLSAVHPDDREAMQTAVSRALQQKGAYKHEYRIQWPDNTLHWIQANGRGNYNTSGSPYNMVGVALDITDRKLAETEREHLLAREQAARVEAEAASRLKDQFLATVSHELRTPMMAILGWANLLRTGQIDKDTSTTALETIERNANSQVQLINDLLDVSRIITGKMRLDIEKVEITSLVRSAIETIRPTAEAKDIQIAVTIQPDMAFLYGDAERLQQIAWNLLSNAVKFTLNGGKIEVHLVCTKTQIELTVSDTGQGIATEFLDQVFGRFRQADQTSTRQYGGLGLGLSIVHQLVELHGGSISAASEGKDRGASFKVLLPLLQGDPYVGPVHTFRKINHNGTQIACPPQLTALRVLVVDDEFDTRSMLQATLEFCGAHVMTAGSVPEALELYKQFQPDVLVSDIGMPNEDGYSLIRKIRALEIEHGKKTPAMALTAYVSQADRDRALAAGFQVHVSKPIETAEFVTLLGSLVEPCTPSRSPR
jgi:PAS domain S-box-containing protein